MIPLLCDSAALRSHQDIARAASADDCDLFKREEEVRDVRDLRGDEILTLTVRALAVSTGRA
jgi:hypothetical protein